MVLYLGSVPTARTPCPFAQGWGFYSQVRNAGRPYTVINGIRRFQDVGFPALGSSDLLLVLQQVGRSGTVEGFPWAIVIGSIGIDVNT
jgi:hypothetical protein